MLLNRKRPFSSRGEQKWLVCLPQNILIMLFQEGIVSIRGKVTQPVLMVFQWPHLYIGKTGLHLDTWILSLSKAITYSYFLFALKLLTQSHTVKAQLVLEHKSGSLTLKDTVQRLKACIGPRDRLSESEDWHHLLLCMCSCTWYLSTLCFSFLT